MRKEKERKKEMTKAAKGYQTGLEEGESGWTRMVTGNRKKKR